MEIIAIAYVRDKKETVKLRKLNQVEKQKAHSEEIFPKLKYLL